MILESHQVTFVVEAETDLIAPTFSTVEVVSELELVGNEGCKAEMISFRVVDWQDEFARLNFVGVLAEITKGSKSVKTMGWMSPLSGGGAVQSELYFNGCPIPAFSKGMTNLSFGGEVDLTLRFYDWAGNLSEPYTTKYTLPSRSSSRCSGSSFQESDRSRLSLLLALLMLVLIVRRIWKQQIGASRRAAKPCAHFTLLTVIRMTPWQRAPC